MERDLDIALVRLAQGGSDVAFERLARRWDARLAAHAWRLLGDREAAREAVQSAWLEIARGLKSLRDPVAFPAWVFRITTRQAAVVIRTRQAERRLAQGLAAAAATEPQTTPPPQPDEAATLHAAIRNLPPDQRAALALHHFEALSVAEVAVALDAPVGTIKTRLMHARRKLRAALEGETHD
ncbi:MAG: sigma-70 family RNA polymerase sigma factor [Caulobacterales bacterium]|nr:sigma-70 family RNA polymerase sigma factor [Caulobacterales bacterium]